jgi:hypothetical protein
MLRDYSTERVGDTWVASNRLRQTGCSKQALPAIVAFPRLQAICSSVP